ncbi:LOW QUALITY PROTEIN: alpha-protein kinase 1 [Molossus nigricans]
MAPQLVAHQAHVSLGTGLSSSQRAESGQERLRRAGRRNWARTDAFRVSWDPDGETEPHGQATAHGCAVPRPWRRAVGVRPGGNAAVRTAGSRNTSGPPRPSLGSASWSSSGSGWPENMATHPLTHKEETFEIKEFSKISYDATDRAGEKSEPREKENQPTVWRKQGDSHGVGGSLGRGCTTACHPVAPLWLVQDPESGQGGGSVQQQDSDPASSVDEEGQLLGPRGQRMCPEVWSGGWDPASGSHEGCTTPEEGSKPGNLLNGSRSCSPSCWTSPAFSCGSSEGDPRSYLNSSRSSSISLAGRTRQETLEARTLQPDDLERVLAGVTPDWLFRERPAQPAPPGVQQEAVAYLGDYHVKKKGRQSSFWAHYLPQEETMDYVGKESKQLKGRARFSDVERQTTAQHYITNYKRLYEQKILTQIFYIPSVVCCVSSGSARPVSPSLGELSVCPASRRRLEEHPAVDRHVLAVCPVPGAVTVRCLLSGM